MSKQKKAATAADVIRARRIVLNTRQEYVSLFSRVVVLALAAYIVFTQVFLITQNKGLDMFPAMKDGDLLIAYRLQNDYSKNGLKLLKISKRGKIKQIAKK